ncbi:hypothetical protein QBC34DRAFT_469850 [Podospora aff. communis PSN243]|uniref:BZIP domain-containing protein n=1 Tax=Podospora aff. communis PSN243 TaxID=3040156 RepID=A0AAV9GHE5_9PEZI|nr:hypothetical protein QBC34DRAFT_469850 [Podospora aff. communis PSN243]
MSHNNHNQPAGGSTKDGDQHPVPSIESSPKSSPSPRPTLPPLRNARRLHGEARLPGLRPPQCAMRLNWDGQYYDYDTPAGSDTESHSPRYVPQIIFYAWPGDNPDGRSQPGVERPATCSSAAAAWAERLRMSEEESGSEYDSDEVHAGSVASNSGSGNGAVNVPRPRPALGRDRFLERRRRYLEARLAMNRQLRRVDNLSDLHDTHASRNLTLPPLRPAPPLAVGHEGQAVVSSEGEEESDHESGLGTLPNWSGRESRQMRARSSR